MSEINQRKEEEARVRQGVSGIQGGRPWKVSLVQEGENLVCSVDLRLGRRILKDSSRNESTWLEGHVLGLK